MAAVSSDSSFDPEAYLPFGTPAEALTDKSNVERLMVAYPVNPDNGRSAAKDFAVLNLDATIVKEAERVRDVIDWDGIMARRSEEMVMQCNPNWKGTHICSQLVSPCY